MKRLSSLMGLCSVAGVAVLVAGGGCGPSFLAGPAAGGSTSSATTSTTASSAGGTGGTGGAAGCTPNACPPDQYCSADTSACAPCSDVGRFHFGQPIPTGVTVSTPNTVPLYPRVDEDTGNLYLVARESNQNHLEIAPVSKSAWSSASPLTQLAAGMYQDSGPLYLRSPNLLTGLVDDGVADAGAPVLLFDSDRINIMGKRRIFAVVLQSGTPKSLNLPDGASLQSGIAMAMNVSPPRFWWLSGETLSPPLVTFVATDNAPTPVAITLLDSGCPVISASAPWVTPGGERLLFASPRYATPPACAVPDATVTHLYQVPIDATGQPLDDAGAELVFPDDLTSVDTTPSLTPNMCTLLFARTNALGTDTRIFAAPRD